jgi:lysophospholipase L1-like esterase
MKLTLSRLSLATLFLVLAGSVGLNVVLYRLALSRYRQEQSVRLDPSGASRFEAVNASLAPRGRGQSRVVFFGDSRAEMWAPQPDLGPGVEVVNRGWGGETTAQSLLRLDRDVLALRPDLVVIQVGINDLKGIGLLPDKAPEIERACGDRIERIADRIREQEIPVALLTIFPVGPVPLARRPIWSDATLGAVARVNARLARLNGPGLVVIDCDGVLADRGRARTFYALDEFHLNANAYTALNRHVEPILRRLLTVQDSRSTTDG